MGPGRDLGQHEGGGATLGIDHHRRRNLCGFHTPTEAAVLASVYALLVSAFVYRELNWQALWDVTIESARLTAMIFLILASAGLFAWVLTVGGCPRPWRT